MAELKTDAIAMMEKYMSKKAIEMANKMYEADLMEIEKNTPEQKIFKTKQPTSSKFAFC